MSKQSHIAKKTQSLYVIINSLCAYLTMSIVLIYGYYFFQMAVAKLFYIQSTLYFDRIIFISRDAMWSPKIVLVSYSAPVVFSFFASIFFFYMYVLLRRQLYLVRIYCLWGHIISIGLFFSSFIHGAFAYKGFAVIFKWFNIAEKWNYLLAVIGIIGLCIMGLYIGLWFLKMAPSKEFDVHKKPRKFLFQVAMLPFLIAAIITSSVLIIKLQDSIPLVVIQLGIFLMLSFTILRAEPLPQRVVLVKNSATGKFSLPAVLIGVFSLIAAIYLTYKGISL
ncbi:hypothetical protein [Thermoflexibacter ruber]|uniref:Uncharacterized protein n=1 Tax=Thermoflexibacter ruber TaxID=1003 RepID=A0A1I2J656_9BACT|nr:hypothetical protein [Thermoflexibacter ruber]SFF48181.1 hypothetical protein SAMN04488541_104012 [Thermoflexibacter ruber]